MGKFTKDATELLKLVGGKENIQVKFIEFPLHGNLTDAVGDAVGQHDHARQGQIRMVLAVIQ